MNDMSAVIVPKSDQINADDLISGPITITIEEVQIKGGQEQPVSIYFAGSDKAFRPCKSMSRVLVAAWGADANKYVGRALTLYRDPSVKWGGMEVGGIRISHMSHMDREMVMALTATKGSRKPYKVSPLAKSNSASAAIGNPTDDARTKAEQWVGEHIEAVHRAPDLGAFARVAEKGAKGLARLEEGGFDDLHAQVQAAYDQKRADLAAQDDAFGQGEG